MGTKKDSKGKIAGKPVKSSKKQSEELYRLIFDNAPSGIFHFDKNGIITSCNDNFVKIIGSSRKALIGLNTLKLSNKKVVSEIKKTLKGKPGYYEGIYESETGHKTTQIKLSLSPIKNKGKQIDSGIGIVDDITERKVSEEWIKIILNEQRTILSTVSVGISHVIDRKIIWSNEAHDKMFGYKAGETKGINTEVFFADKAQYQKLGKEGYPLLKGGKKYYTETELKKKNGTKIWCGMTGHIINKEHPEEGYIWILQDISERKESENAVKESEERNRLVMENSLDGIILSVSHGPIFSANPAACRMLQRTEEEICNSTREELIDFNDPNFKIFVEERRRAGKAKGELYMFRKDGTRFPAEVSSTLFEDSKGQKKTGMIIRDISERKQAEEILSISESQLKAVLNNSRDAIGVHVDGVWEMCNPAAVRLFGFRSEDEAVGTLLLNVIAKDEHERIKNFVRLRKEGKEAPHEYVTRGLKQDGTEFDMDVRLSSFQASGKTHVVVTLRDITEQKAAEKRIEEQIKNFRLLFDNSPIGILSASTDGTILDSNNSLLTMLGSPSLEDTKKINIIKFPPLVKSGYSNNFKKCVEDNTIVFFEFPYTSKWGNDLYFASYLVPFTNDEGAVVKIYNFMVDITERKKSEEEAIQNEKNFRLLFESSPLGIYMAAPDGTIIDGNSALIKILGSPSLEATKQINVLTFPPLVENGYADNFRKCVKENRVIFIEIFYRTKWGRELFLSSYLVPLANDKGEVEKVYTLMSDITERKIAERGLIQHAEEINNLYESSIDLAGLPESMDKLLNSIVKKAILLLNRKDGGLYLFDNEKGDLFVAATTNTMKSLGSRVKFGEGMAGRVAESRKPLIIDDYSKWEFRLPLYDGSDLTTVIEVPIIYRDELLGVLVIEEYGKEAARFTEDDLRVLTIFAGQVAGAIYSAKEYYHVKQIMEELDNYFTSALDLFCIASLDGKFVKLNKEWENVLGYNISELIGKDIFDYVHPDDHEPTRQAIKDQSNGKAIFNFINRYMTKGGSYKIIEWRSKASGNLLYAAARDITERKQTEDALRQSEEKFYKAFNNSPLILSLSEIDTGKFIEVNETACSLSGFSRNEVIGKTSIEMGWISRDDRKRIQTILKNEGMVKDLQLELHSKNGTKITVSYSANIIEIDGKKVLLSISENLTERMKAEIALKESEERLRTLINSTPDIICFKDKDGRWLIANESYLQLLKIENYDYFGKKDEELAGHTDPLLKNVFQKCIEADRMAWESKTIYKTEMTVPGTNGTNKVFDMIEAPVFEANGERQGLVILGRDVTIQKKNEEILMKLNIELQSSRIKAEEALDQKNLLVNDLTLIKDKLEKINSEKDKFFSIIAHDLKSPFQGFIGLTELISEDFNNFNIAELSELTKDMHDNATNLFKLLENLLLWARMQQGSVGFSPVEINLSDIVWQNIRLIEKRGEQKEVNIISQVTPDKKLTADEEMLNTILRNLLSNALKFTKRGGKIVVDAKRQENNMMEISVADTGIGMTEELSSRIFSINEKVGREGTEGEKSTGLGLLLCKEFVEKHGGRIWVESEADKGSTFYFTLPVALMN